MHLKVAPLDDDEYEFLREYHSVLALISAALKSIESDSYKFSLYLPSLFGLKIQLQALLDKRSVFECIPLVIALQNGIEARFGNLMDPFDPEKKSVPLFIAMMTNPQFKLNFMGMKKIQPRLLNRLKDMLVSEAVKIEDESLSQNNSHGDDDDDADEHAHAQAHEHGNYYRTIRNFDSFVVFHLSTNVLFYVFF